MVSGDSTELAQSPRVLVVDDERAVRTVLQVNLTRHGLTVDLASGVAEAFETLKSQRYDLILTDVKMPDGSGLDLLVEAKSRWPHTEIVVMTGHGSVDDAVKAMQAGAAHYLLKPIERDALYVILDRALENGKMRAELVQLRQEVKDRYGFDNLIGSTDEMVRIYEDISAVANSDITVLLWGPTGTGKELLATALHHRSVRAKQPFIRVNCGAIPEALIESELFGHERGAFTGAVRQHRGKFEQAHGGTIFLDEIGEIPSTMQVKLLRVLENAEFQRVGGTETLGVDVRVVAATNRNLRVEVAEGRFREDLYYRLNVVEIRVPALAERRADIPLLVDHFVSKYAIHAGKQVPDIAVEDMTALSFYAWPGNVRELEHVVQRAVVLHRDGERFRIRPPDAEPPRRDAQPTPTVIAPPTVAEDETLPEALHAFERRAIIDALRACGGVQAKAAKRLGISTSNFSYRMKKLGIRRVDVQYE